MAKKAAPKMTKKEQEEAKKRRRMVILLALLMVGIMLFTVLLQFISPSTLPVNNNGNLQETGNFNSIADVLKRLPASASYVRFVDLNASQAVTDWAKANLGHNLPNESLFGRLPYKDVIASFPYPTMGMGIIEDPQVIVLSDFGRGYDNASYQQTTIEGVPLRIILGSYAFSTDSHPTIIGRKEYVSAIDRFIKGSTQANTAYSTYVGLLARANMTVENATLAVVGKSDSLGFGDLFYAGITPLNGTQCDYKIIIHLNQTLNESRMNDIGALWQMGSTLYEIDANAPQFKDDYVTLSARGDIDKCLDSMMKSWDFLRG